MAKGKGPIQGWITKNGVHIPIYGNYTVREGEEPKAKGSKFKSGEVTAKTVSKALKKEYDEDSKETWYEGKINGKDVRITQETAGSDKFWNVDIGKPGNRHKLLTDNNEPMSFKSLEDAHDEIAHELNSKSGQDSVASKGKRAVMTKSEFDAMNKEIDARDETEHLKKWEGQYDKAIAEGASVKKGKKDRNVLGQEVDFAEVDRTAKEREKDFIVNTPIPEGKAWERTESKRKAMEAADEADAYDRQHKEGKYTEGKYTEAKQESSKTTPESYAQSKGKSIRDIAQEVNNNDAARAQANQLMKDGRSYDEAAALAHQQHFKEQTSSTLDMRNETKSLGDGGKVTSRIKAQEQAYVDNAFKPQVSEKERKMQELRDAERAYVNEAFKGNTKQESSASDLHSRIQAQAEQADVHRQRTSVKKVQSPRTPKLVAPTEEMKRELGIDKDYGTHNVSAAKETMRRYKTESPLYAEDKVRRYAKAAQAEKAKAQSIADAISGVTGIANSGSIQNMSPSGLKSAYAEATGARKTKLANELRKRGYQLTGGRWTKKKS